MKAVLMTRVGGPEVLESGEVADPELPSPYHIRVRLRAAGVNPVDTKVRSLHMFYPDRLPAVLGCDGAGTVEAVGDAVSRFRVGDAVYFFNNGLGYGTGNYAEQTVVHEDYAAKKPRNLSMEEAAAVPLVLITAWEALVDRAQLKAEETVLVHAGAGGVGHVATQLAKHLGAYVATTVSSEDKAEFARSLGADHTINYKDEDFVEAALDWTDGKGMRVILDTVGGPTFCRSFGAARVFGKVVTLLSTACDVKAINTARLRNLLIGYVQMTAPLYLGLHNARLAQTRILEQGAKLIEDGKLRVKVSEALPLAQAAEAHRRVEAGHTVGKIVLTIP
ncbi:MAG TPA: zinc-dependent alcohol dehydrogenase family protein [Pelomicrobium sp.]|nr:zinc-dependent alcohol dehydrogenase family protein [Pelomicrobium sp.]